MSSDHGHAELLGFGDQFGAAGDFVFNVGTGGAHPFHAGAGSDDQRLGVGGGQLVGGELVVVIGRNLGLHGGHVHHNGAGALAAGGDDEGSVQLGDFHGEREAAQHADGEQGDKNGG